MSEKSRMLCVAKDTDGSAWCFRERPVNIAGVWSTESPLYSELHKDVCPDIRPGECRMYIEFAPRVAEESTFWRSDNEWALVWVNGEWVWSEYQEEGDIILPTPPDPTPYLTPADPKAARREEIRAQIAALQEELEGMEG